MNRLAVILAALALAGCGGGAADDKGGAPAAGAPIPGGGLTVSEAIASDLEGPLMVKGYVIDGRLCEAILESDPLQCGGPSLRLDGDLTQLGDAGPQSQVSLLGTVEDGAFVLNATSR